MRSLTLLLFAASLLASSAAAADTTVRVTVRDIVDSPLAGAVATCTLGDVWSGSEETTEASEVLRLRNVPLSRDVDDERLRCTVVCAGYEAHTLRLTVTNNAATTVRLVPAYDDIEVAVRGEHDVDSVVKGAQLRCRTLDVGSGDWSPTATTDRSGVALVPGVRHGATLECKVSKAPRDYDAGVTSATFALIDDGSERTEPLRIVIALPVLVKLTVTLKDEQTGASLRDMRVEVLTRKGGDTLADRLSNRRGKVVTRVSADTRVVVRASDPHDRYVAVESELRTRVDPGRDSAKLVMRGLPPLPTTSLCELKIAQSTVRKAADGSALALARSYDNHAWEQVPNEDVDPATIELSCPTSTSEDCLLRVDDDWRIVELDVPAHLCSAPTPVHAAHVLEHAGLGASIAEITEFKRAYRRADPLPATSGAPGVANSPLDVEAFVVDQMDESKTPPTLLREYARARSNPRVRAGSPSGYVREACSIGSRWHAHAFNQYDIGATIIVRTGASVHTLSIDGVDRTQVTEFHNVSAPAAVPQSSVQICAVDEAVGGSMWVSINGCSSLYAEYPNPRVEFRSTPSNTWAPDAAKTTFANVASYRTSAVVLSALTDTSVCPSERPRFLLHAGAYYLFDPRLASQHNTLDAPARAVAPETGVATQCVPLPKTFVNEASCEARQTCSGLQTASSTPVKLDTSTLAEFWSAGGRLVFTIDPDDLDVRESPYNDSPCSSSDGEATSRWRRTAIGNGCAAETTLRDDNAVATKATLKAAIEAALRQSPVNPHVVDIGFPLCDANSEQIGMSLTVSGPGGVLECATHVHPLAYAVLDFSVYAHSLDSDWDWDFDDGERNPIVAVAESGGTQLSLPRLVSMNDLRNRVHKNRVTVVGRLDDTVEFDELPASLRTPVLATHFGATLRSARGDAPLVEVCGSPGEIENNGLLGARYPTQETRDWSDKMKELDWRMYSSHAKDNMWLNALLNRGRVADGKNEDVLRQRVAWALAQVFPVSVSTVSLDNWWEPWAAYYDIFVRHAFGSYRDILKEVSWSPIMARYLSFWRNRAFSDSGSFPDENYAREFLQLFSLGLWKLNDDGTYPVDAQGNRIDAYSNEDILDHARLWTGFDDQESRPNMEDDNGGKTTNYLDPMQLKPQWHDLMPKTNLDGGFLGDGYPRCVDLPSRHWLSKGATYELTGEQSLEGLQLDLAAERDPDGIGRRPRFEPNPSTSALYAALCAPNGSGRCTFPTSVTLTDNLDCDGEQECNAGSVLTVKIVCQVTARVRYFFYRHVPCVRMAFFAAADGQVAKNGGAMQCANRHTPSAYTSCCRVEVDGSTRHSRGNYDPEICMFLNERVTADVAAARCSAVTGATTETTDALGMCDEFSAGPYNSFERSCASSNLAWTTATCALKVQVYSENGRVTVIDDLDEGRYAVLARSRDSFFRVYWGELGYPLATQRETCADNCEYVPASDGAGTCVCDIEVVDTAVYAPSDTLPASLDDLARSLPVGAAKPDSFDGGRRAEKYSKCTSTVCATLESTRSIEVWVRNLSPDNTWPIDTIFVLPPRRAGGALRYRSNRASTVYVGGTPGDYSSATRFSFRNAPTFMPLAGEQNSQYTEWNNRKMLLPNVEADINALLDAVFEHDNVAPFVAYRLIQRLVTSNPSRRYMRSVVDAFRSGTYAGRTYSGKYGDMGAAVAAVVLDQEARSLTLQAEPRAGMLREPVLKLVHFMRALEFETLDTREVMMPELFAQLGQMAFHQPSVFGFFLPEFRPDGRVSAVGLAAPEFEIFTTPRIMSWLNGITSLVDYGLTSCENGFGYTSPEQGRRCWNEEGRLNTTDGWLQFAPTTRSLGYGPWVADELATVLTSGRASPETRKRIGAEYDAVIMLGGSTDEALRRVVKLYAMAQEFHTNAVRMPGVPRTPAPVNSAGRGREYRAVVVIFLAGGADSYSMLVPHTCASNLHDEYASVRGGAALNRATQMLEISSDASEQPCSKFGVHHRMPHLKSLYDAGEAAFLANVGAMVEPVTKEDYDGSSGVVKQWPPSLFSHNIMQRSMQNLHAQVASSKGVLGRCVQALLDNAKPYAAELVSIAGASKILEGTKAPDMVDARGGVEQFAQFESFRTSIDSLCDNVTASAMADTYAEGVLASIERTETIGPAVQSIELTEDFPTSTLGNQMAQVARMVRYHKQVGSERAAFLTLKGGWDTHGTFDLGDLYGDVDSSLNAFSDEMRDFGAWDNVAVMTVSDFGRTLTPNSEGTDHAWAGNYFLAGGAVNGGKIFGKYPSSLTESGEVSIGRGRLLPTHSFEAVWAGLAEWLGVESDQMDDVLPNLANFASDPELVWTESELFRSTKK